MARSRQQENSIKLDPTREKIAKNMSVLPGSPGNLGQNNDPSNVLSVGPQMASLDGVSKHPYGDSGAKYRQMGADVLNPMMVPHSPLQQNTPIAARGLNANVPYGMQQQPPTQGNNPMTDMMEASRYNMAAAMQDKPQSAMGLTGLPAQPAPGAFPSDMPGTSGPMLMAADPSASMVPGSSPQKVNQKKKGGIA